MSSNGLRSGEEEVAAPPQVQALLSAIGASISSATSRDPPAAHCPVDLPPRQTSSAAPALSDRTLRLLLDAAPDAMVVVDRSGTIVLVNAQVERMFGHERADLLGRPVEALMPLRYRGRHVFQRNEYFQHPRSRPMGAGLKLFGLHRDGHEIPVEISLSPLLVDGQTLATASIRDISERERLEARYRTLVEEIPAVTFIASLEGGRNELYVSPQIQTMLGFTQREWLEDPVLWFRQLHPEDRERWHQEFARTCMNGTPFRANYRFMAKDGRTVWVHGEAKVVRDAAGRPMFLQGIAFDITERVQAEQVLRRSAQELERLVEQRTVELKADIAARQRTEEALQQANEQLRQKNEEIEQFVYAVSHDLKSPLVSCDSFASLAEMDMKAGRLDDAALDLSRVRHATEKMRRAIEDLLQLSRVGRVRNEPGRVDANALVREVVDSMVDRISAAQATVQVLENLPAAWADHGRLASALENLIGNALKYGCPASGGRIEIGGQREGAEVRYFVRDFGPGIAPEYHKKVFSLFQRIDTQKEGSGVGLAIVAKVAETHGGRAWVESQPGQGATFWIALPDRSQPAP